MKDEGKESRVSLPFWISVPTYSILNKITPSKTLTYGILNSVQCSQTSLSHLNKIRKDFHLQILGDLLFNIFINGLYQEVILSTKNLIAINISPSFSLFHGPLS